MEECARPADIVPILEDHESAEMMWAPYGQYLQATYDKKIVSYQCFHTGTGARLKSQQFNETVADDGTPEAFSHIFVRHGKILRSNPIVVIENENCSLDFETLYHAHTSRRRKANLRDCCDFGLVPVQQLQ